MRINIIFVLLLMVACKTQNKSNNKDENTHAKVAEVVPATAAVSSKPASTTQRGTEQCYTDVCLQLRNHDTANKSFEIYMVNSVSVFGFQCDLPGINITGSDGGLLKANDYQTSNSTSRILSFSMQAKPIPNGEGVLTKIYYSDPTSEVCMTEIIFAGIGGSKLKNDIPECLQLN